VPDSIVLVLERNEPVGTSTRMGNGYEWSTPLPASQIEDEEEDENDR